MFLMWLALRLDRIQLVKLMHPSGTQNRDARVTKRIRFDGLSNPRRTVSVPLLSRPIIMKCIYMGLIFWL